MPPALRGWRRRPPSLGASVAVEEFALDRIDPVAACLEVDGTRFDGVPVFDAPATGADGIAGTLGTVGSDAAIAVAELSPHAVYSGEYRALRNSSRACRPGDRLPGRATGPWPC